MIMNQGVFIVYQTLETASQMSLYNTGLWFVYKQSKLNYGGVLFNRGQFFSYKKLSFLKSKAIINSDDGCFV